MFWGLFKAPGCCFTLKSVTPASGKDLQARGARQVYWPFCRLRPEQLSYGVEPSRESHEGDILALSALWRVVANPYCRLNSAQHCYRYLAVAASTSGALDPMATPASSTSLPTWPGGT